MLGALYVYYQREARDCVHVWLSADTDHYCSSEGDKGWGCGYRNFQMLLSSLQRMEPYTTCLSGTHRQKHVYQNITFYNWFTILSNPVAVWIA